MEKIERLINALAEELKGHNALIQVQVENTYLSRKVGDVNKLAERPKVQVVTADMSFPEWMAAQIMLLTLRPGTIANHRNCLAHLRAYRSDFRFSDIDHTFVMGFEHYLRAVRLSVNTVAKVMKIFRRYVNLAMDDEIFITNAFRKYKVRTEKKERPVLTEREIKRMENVETANDEEARVRDSFLLALYTGLRYSDVCRTRKGDLRTIGRRKWLMMRQRKTGREVRIPVGALFGGKAVPLIGVNAPPNARCNVILKRLCRRSHIRKPVTMHTARRTCATILTARGVSLPVVQHVLGHESIRTTEGYVSTIMGTISRAVSKAWR